MFSNINYIFELIISGVACINPPIPPPETHLVVQYTNNTAISFGSNVTYLCEDGYFFEEDYNLKNYTITCLNDGNFTSPLPWKNCLNPRSKKSFEIHKCLCLLDVNFIDILLDNFCTKVFCAAFL